MSSRSINHSENMKHQGIGRKFFAAMISVILVVGLMPTLNLQNAYATENDVPATPTTVEPAAVGVHDITLEGNGGTFTVKSEAGEPDFDVWDGITATPADDLAWVNDAYQLNSAADLAGFRDMVNSGVNTADAQLNVDCDMSVVNWVPINTADLEGYTGIFNGKGHTVVLSGEMTGSDESWGFFGSVAREVTEDDTTVGTVENLICEGSVTANTTGEVYVGGICAYSLGGMFKDCVNKISMDLDTSGTWGYMHAGGIVGYDETSTIVNCGNEADITGSMTSSSYWSCAGGIVGRMLPYASCGGYSYIENCYNWGDISATNQNTSLSYFQSAGGIVGFVGQPRNNGTNYIVNCYSTGDVSAAGKQANTGYAGAILGFVYLEGNNKTCLQYCYWPQTSSLDSYGGHTSSFTISATGNAQYSDTSDLLSDLNNKSKGAGDTRGLGYEVWIPSDNNDLPYFESSRGGTGGAGGTEEVSSITLVSDANGYIAQSDYQQPTHPDGLEFAGWTDNPEGTGTVYTEEDLLNWAFDEDITFYAKWQPATYSITVNPIQNGSVKVEIDGTQSTTQPAYATAGQAITVSVTPDDGYAIRSVTITDANGLVIASGITGSYSFTMPASDVTIEVVTIAASVRTVTLDGNGGYFEGEAESYPADIFFGGYESRRQPIGNYYSNASSVSLYLADEIEDAQKEAGGTVGAGEITSLAFYVTRAVSSFAPTLNVYLSETDATSLNQSDRFSEGDFTKVYSSTGNIGSQTGWEIWEFDEPFEYHGGNLLVAVGQSASASADDLYYSTSYTSGKSLCKGRDGYGTYSDPFNSSDGWFNQELNYRADIQLGFMGAPVQLDSISFMTDEDGKIASSDYRQPTNPDGLEFAGWTTDKEGKGELLQESDLLSMSLGADTTFYAQWKAITYNVTFNGNGGEFVVEGGSGGSGGLVGSITLETDGEGRISQSDYQQPTREGYTFVGWTIDQAGRGDLLQESDLLKMTFEADATYYAQWKEVGTFYVTLDGNGGTFTVERTSDISVWDGSESVVPSADADGIYRIASAAKLAGFSDGINDGTIPLDANAQLTIDCDMSAGAWTPIADLDSSYDTNYYAGTFDGDSHVVTVVQSITQTSEEDDYWGFFGEVSGTVKNLTLEGSVDIARSADTCVGGFAAMSYDGTFVGCVNRMTINLNIAGGYNHVYAGGLVGLDRTSTIVNCGNEADITAVAEASNYAGAYVGGIVGYVFPTSASPLGYSHVENCYNWGDVGVSSNSTSTTYPATAGGIAGFVDYPDNNNSNYFCNCYSSGDVSASAGDASAAPCGAILGYIVQLESNLSYLQYCYWPAGSSLPSYGGVTGSIDTTGTVQYSGVTALRSDLNDPTKGAGDTRNLGYATWIPASDNNDLPYFGGASMSGTEEVQSISLVTGTDSRISADAYQQPTHPDGLKFLGWTTDQAGKGELLQESDLLSATFEADVTYYAQWEKIVIEGAVVSGIDAAYTYTGSAHEPVPVVTLGGVTLAAGRDYVVSYEDNIDVGKATVTITGAGNYTGVVTATFEITAAPVTITCADASKVYGEADPGLSGSVVGLVRAGDLGEITYTRAVGEDVGEYAISAAYTPNNNYEVSVVEGTFTITAASLNGAKVSGLAERYTYIGSQITPYDFTVTIGDTILEFGKDYTLTYGENTDAGTTGTISIEGIGNYTGTFDVTFEIAPAPVTITCADASKVYGEEDPGLSGSVVGLVHAGDLGEITYTRTDGEAVGKYAITANYTPNSNYTVSVVDGTLEITPADLSTATVTFDPESYEYTGDAITPEPTVKLGDVVLDAKSDYTLSYSDNVDPGEATVTVTGTGNYTGSATGTFTIEEAPEPEPTPHEITIDPVDHASVSVDPSEAAAGDTVTITVIPDKNYKVDSVTVIDALGSEVKVTAAGDNTYTFTMPDADVVVKVTVSENSEPGEHKIDVEENAGGSVSVPEEAQAGDTVTVKVTADDGFAIATFSILDAYGNPVEYTDNGDGTYTFTMPDSAIIVEVTFVEAEPEKITITTDMFEVDTSYGIYDGTNPVTKTISSNLTEGVDYTVTYKNNTSAGEATITIEGIGDYTGSLEYTFKVIHYFEDVGAAVNDVNEWYFDAVYGMVDLGAITGYNETIFGVGDAMSRAQLVTIMWRYCEPDEYAAYDEPAAKDTTGLPDAQNGMYYTGAVNWAYANEVITGNLHDDGTYTLNPDDPATFDQLVTILARYCLGSFDEAADYPQTALNSGNFTDAGTVEDFARGSMSWAIANGVVTGNDNHDGTWTLFPLEDVVRERAVTVLYRSIEEGLL